MTNAPSFQLKWEETKLRSICLLCQCETIDGPFVSRQSESVPDGCVLGLSWHLHSMSFAKYFFGSDHDEDKESIPTMKKVPSAKHCHNVRKFQCPKTNIPCVCWQMQAHARTASNCRWKIKIIKRNTHCCHCLMSIVEFSAWLSVPVLPMPPPVRPFLFVSL